jgi:hypothetical protein
LHLSRGLPPGNRWEAQGPKVKIADELHHRCCCCVFSLQLELKIEVTRIRVVRGKKIQKRATVKSHINANLKNARARARARRVSFFLETQTAVIEK